MAHDFFFWCPRVLAALGLLKRGSVECGMALALGDLASLCAFCFYISLVGIQQGHLDREQDRDKGRENSEWKELSECTERMGVAGGFVCIISMLA